MNTWNNLVGINCDLENDKIPDQNYKKNLFRFITFWLGETRKILDEINFDLENDKIPGQNYIKKTCSDLIIYDWWINNDK